MMDFVLGKMKSLNVRVGIMVFSFITVTIGVIVAYVATSSMSNSREMGASSLTELSETLSRSISLELGEYLKNAKLVAAQGITVEALQNPLKVQEAQELLKLYLANREDLWSLFIIDRTGKVVAGVTSRGDDERGKSKKELSVVRETLEGKPQALAKSVEKIQAGDRLVYRVAVQIKDQAGAVLGVVQLACDFTAFSAKVVDTVTPGHTGYSFVLDEAGTTIAHGLGKAMILRNDQGLEFVRRILGAPEGFLEYEFGGKTKLLAWRNVPETGWKSCVVVLNEELAAGAIAQRNTIVLIGILAVVGLTLLLYATIRRTVISPLLAIQEFSKDIASGNYASELTGRFSCELADLAANVRAMKVSIKAELGFAKGVLGGITLPCCVFDKDNKALFVNQDMLDVLERKETPEACLGLTSGDLVHRDSSRETISTRALREGKKINQETTYKTPSGREKTFDVTSTPIRDLEGQVLGTLAVWFELTEIRAQQAQIGEQRDRIAKAAEQAEEVSRRLAQVAGELAARIEESSRGSEIQKERVGETATAIEQMNASTIEVARNSETAASNAAEAKERATSGQKVVGDSTKAIARVENTVKEMKHDLAELGKQVDGIGAIMDMISDIADQTNLLALNAAIEAARAGEHGRGFAVVADEVRKLAEKTMGATKQVGESINAIQSGTSKSVGRMDGAVREVETSVELTRQAGLSLEEIVTNAVATADMVRNIATAAEEQSATSEQIARSAEEINVIATDTATAMNQSSEAVTELSSLAGELNGIIQRMQG